MSKRKRVSLSTRLQPYENTLLAEVVDWLNTRERDDKNSLIADALTMAYLPYARANKNVSQSELERCCWETQDMLDKHGFNLRQSLQVSQPQWHSTTMPREISSDARTAQSMLNSLDSPLVENEESEDEDDFPTSLIEGEGDYDDGLFDD